MVVKIVPKGLGWSIIFQNSRKKIIAKLTAIYSSEGYALRMARFYARKFNHEIFEVDVSCIHSRVVKKEEDRQETKRKRIV